MPDGAGVRLHLFVNVSDFLNLKTTILDCERLSLAGLSEGELSVVEITVVAGRNWHRLSFGLCFGHWSS